MKKILLCFGLIVSCDSGSLPDHSRSNEIVTNLNTQETYRYWVDTVENRYASPTKLIYQAECSSAGILLPSHCQLNKKSFDYQIFKTKLEGSMASDIEAVKMQITLATREIEHLENEISALKDAIEQDEHHLGLGKQEKTILENKINETSSLLAEYKQQLDLIDQALSITMNDGDLEILAKHIAAELNPVRTRLAIYVSDMVDIKEKLAELESRVASGKHEIGHLNAQLSKLIGQLSLDRVQLSQLESDFGFYEEVLVKLESGILYRITDASAWHGHNESDSLFSNIKPFVRKFEELFSINSKP